MRTLLIRFRRRTLLLALAILGISASALPAAVITVGSDGACNHTTITNALFAAIAAGPDEIRIARNQAYTNIFIHLTDWSPATTGVVTLAGGYDTCSDTVPSGHTTIDGQAANPVVEVDTSGQPTSEVILRNLDLTGSGEEGLRVEGGGIVTSTGNLLRSNLGGGAVVVDGGTFHVDAGTEILQNSNSGITCFTGSEVNFAGWIHDNTATAGAGIVAGSSCDMNILTGAWIRGNDAAFGGGLFASSGASVHVDGSGTSSFETQIEGNTATDQGGGIYATGSGTVVLLWNASVNNNDAGDEGGGIWASSSALVTMDRVEGNCFNPLRCTNLSSNGVVGGAHGAAAWVESGADLQLYQTRVESNTNDPAAPVGSVLFATGAGSTVTVEGVNFWNNQGPDALFEGQVGSSVSAAFVTASGNSYNSGTLPASPIALTGGSTGTLNSSIYFPNSSVIGGASLTEVDCLILSNTTGLPGGASFINTSDPLFVSAAVGNLRLRPSSPAVDYCDTVLYTPVHFDGDHEQRGFDLAFNANGTPGVTGGIYDLGFDEVAPLFSDGFETSNTSAWSTTVP